MRVARSLLGRVEAVGLRRAVEARVEQLPRGQEDAARSQVLVGADDGLVDALDDDLEVPRLEAERAQVVEGIVREAPRPAVRVGGAHQHIVLGVELPVRVAQLGHHLLLHRLEHHAQVRADENHALAIARRGEDEGARAQALVDARRLLLQLHVPQHPHPGGRAGDVMHPAADEERLLPGTGATESLLGPPRGRSALFLS